MRWPWRRRRVIVESTALDDDPYAAYRAWLEAGRPPLPADLDTASASVSPDDAPEDPVGGG